MSRKKQLEAKLAEYVKLTGRGNMEKANMTMVEIVHLLRPGLYDGNIEEEMSDSAPVMVLPPSNEDGTASPWDHAPDHHSATVTVDHDLLDRVVGKAEDLVQDVHDLSEAMTPPSLDSETMAESLINGAPEAEQKPEEKVTEPVARVLEPETDPSEDAPEPKPETELSDHEPQAAPAEDPPAEDPKAGDPEEDAKPSVPKAKRGKKG